jgi:spore coat polysaccharide biosynthesis predicted glycosyltransferase SpsG
LKKNKIFIRADGNPNIGLGHVMRGVSLVEILYNLFDCVFVISKPSTAICAILEPIAEVHNLQSEDDLIWLKTVNPNNDLVVLDGYQFNTQYHKDIKQLGIKLVVIDDNADIHYCADLIINHGSPKIISKYRTEPYTRILPGFNLVSYCLHLNIA